MFTAKSRSRRILTVLLLALLADPLGAAGLMPGADEKWRHLQSDHFEVYSRNSESESRVLLHNLELVHAIFFQTFGFSAVRVLPVTVYFFSRDKYFEAYKPTRYQKVDNIATFYHGEIDRGILTVAPLPSYEAAQQLAFSGYTYHLFRLLGEHAPVWYSYGLSGILRNLDISSPSFELGRPDPDQVARLQHARLIPVEVMLGADQQSDTFMANQSNSLFHDESWALVHYLYFGQHKFTGPAVAAFADYALKNNRNFDAAATRQVFEEKLGLTYAQMNTELDRYFRGGRYGFRKIPLPAIAPEKSYAVRKVPLEEINLRLAELALRVNRAPQGRLALLQAADHAADAARIQEALGADAVKDGDWSIAVDRWHRALEAGSANPAVLYELCQFESRERFRQFDLDFRLPEEDSARLRDLLQRAIAAAPLEPTAYELLAWVEAAAAQPQIAHVNLVQAHFPGLKEKERTMLALAVVRLRLGDKPGAAGILDQIGQMDPGDWVRYGAELTRARLEDRPVNRDNLPAKRAGAAPAGRLMQPGIVKPKE